MIGAEILIWGMEKHTRPYWSAIHHYLWDSNIGHCALKLTIPSNSANDSLVYQACKHSFKDKARIPHLRIKREIAGKIENFWVIYFSWWPRNKLQEEYSDRLNANRYLQVEYHAELEKYFPGTMESPTGFVRDYLGSAIYNFIFGAPPSIPKPIECIVHRHHPNATILTTILEKKETDLLAVKGNLLSKADQFLKVNENQEKLSLKNQCLAKEPRSATINAVISDTKRLLALVEDELKSLEEEIASLWETHKRLSGDLKLFKREYYHEVATIGVNPQSIFLPLGEHLSYEKLLAAMHKIATGSYPFDIMLNNCAAAVREVIAAGLSEQAKNADFSPHILDTPFKLHRSVCVLQKKLTDLRATEDATKIPILPSYRMAAAKAASLPVIPPAPGARWYIKPC